jgi:hypothetical protein
MPEEANVKVTNPIDTIEQANLAKSIIEQGAAGKAYQSVALSSAIAVQDATDQLRNTGVLALSATGAGLAKMIETGDIEQFVETVESINNLLDTSATHFAKVTQAASQVLSGFPD